MRLRSTSCRLVPIGLFLADVLLFAVGMGMYLCPMIRAYRLIPVFLLMLSGSERVSLLIVVAF